MNKNVPHSWPRHLFYCLHDDKINVSCLPHVTYPNTGYGLTAVGTALLTSQVLPTGTKPQHIAFYYKSPAGATLSLTLNSASGRFVNIYFTFSKKVLIVVAYVGQKFVGYAYCLFEENSKLFSYKESAA